MKIRGFRVGVLAVGSLTMAVVACSAKSDTNTNADDPTRSVGQGLVGTSLSAYSLGSTVTVNYDAMSGAASDWVAVAEVGMPDNQFVAWAYTNGQLAGTRDFANLPGGSYEVRAYFDWAGTSSYTVQYRSSFTIQGTANAVLTPPTNPGANQAIIVNYSGMPGNRTDWIAIAQPGAPGSSLLSWAYTNGGASGSVNLRGLPPGDYVARAYFDWQGTSSFNFTGEAPFTVVAGTGAPALTVPSSPTPTTPIVVNFSSFPGYTSDWVSIAAAGSADNTLLAYRYTKGGFSGSVDFGTLAAGNYEARGYGNWSGTSSYNVIARQAFAVATAAPTGTLVFDGFPGTGNQTQRGAGDACGVYVNVSTNATITSIAVRNDLSANGNLKYVVFRHSDHALIYVSPPKAVVDDGDTWKQSNGLSVALEAGQAYDIGAIADVAGGWSHAGVSVSQGPFTSVASNPNWTNYASPTVVGHAGSSCAVRLYQ